MGVHPEARRSIHLANSSAGLAYRLGDIGCDEVDARNV